jgi:hypothetical protein
VSIWPSAAERPLPAEPACSGLKDGAEALGGHLEQHSPTGTGTILDIDLPLDHPGGPGLPPDIGGPAENATRGLAADHGTRFDHP